MTTYTQPEPTRNIALQQALSTSTERLLKVIGLFSEEQATAKPEPNAWTVVEVLEHIFLTEHIVFNILRTAPTQAGKVAAGTSPQTIDTLTKILQNRQKLVVAPETVSPKGRFSSLKEITEAILKKRQTIQQQLQEADLADDVEFPHPFFGNMNKKQWVDFMLLHTERHCQQMEILANHTTNTEQL